MVDIVGNQLNIGDKVAIAWTNNIRFGIIKEFYQKDYAKIGTYKKIFTSKQLIKI